MDGNPVRLQKHSREDIYNCFVAEVVKMEFSKRMCGEGGGRGREGLRSKRCIRVGGYIIPRGLGSLAACAIIGEFFFQDGLVIETEEREILEVVVGPRGILRDEQLRRRGNPCP
jgi:hypothetical protein